MIETLTISSPSGASINAYVTAPENPCAIIQINHGLAEHAARYRPFMEYLEAAGFAAVAHDHRGHGYTAAPDAPLGQFAQADGMRVVIEDTAFVQDWAMDRWMGVPLIVFGHSMGGLIALATAMTYPDRLHALAVWNANAAPGPMGRVGIAVAAMERAVTSAAARSKIIPSLTFDKWNKDFAQDAPEFAWLSRDPEQVAAYRNDPLCGFAASTGMWLTVLRMATAGEDRKGLRKLPTALPIQLVGGGADPATDQGAALEILAARLRETGHARVALTVTPGARHETLNDLHRDLAMADFVAWANSTLEIPAFGSRPIVV